MEQNNIHIDIELLTRMLAGEATATEIGWVEEWKNNSAENLKQFTELEKVWLAMDNTSPENTIDIDKEWNYLQGKIGIKEVGLNRSRTLFLSIRVAASIIVLLGLFYIGREFFGTKTYSTRMTETREVVLPDGSRVAMNAGSKISYTKSFGNRSRVINLWGEAYFEVKKDTSLPFIINAGKAEVKVLGTSFNVKAYRKSDKVEVTVAEGLVSLCEKDRTEKKVLAAKGEKAIYNKELKAIKKQLNEDRNFISWKTKIVVFENDKLSDIAVTLNSVYHKDFIISNSALRNCTVTTSFENKDLESVIKILESTLDIRIEERDGKVYIKGTGC